ncbi:MAG: bifunctional (p)ppGpp synthetase/guanosine-3',5'-bis(diphosphate) 3'-pyrophosphohydrolase [Dethiobacter sp.]|jgi:GTP pyrophosphokinase|nr:MAG: bifunctional (p)ppGpp synthetase/guanosine-3',5'-bis(diphosphate) 3'-pyrophosphohydrolase [Dethiobacter sp.]
MSLQILKRRFVKYNDRREDWALIRKAYQFALKAHAGQKRVSGESYITHPLGVAYILADLELDLVTIVTGLLHDVLEDTPVSYDEIEKEFGEEVASLVDGVTKLSRMEFRSKEEHQAETWRKMFVAMARDIRVILIKLADRTHNMRTLRYLNSAKQREISLETLEIYAPLAHRLGIYKIKWELEDLSFRYLNKQEYYYLVDKLSKKRREREDFISRMMEILEGKITEAGITADISGRPKHLYSIYNKMKSQGKDFNEIHDLTAVRIIVESVRDCYATLGIVHTLWRPIPGQFNDYIAMPKPNMYQSLHTTVVCAENELLEVQIRTKEMHRTAEFGIAAHWKYKEKVRDDREFEEKLSWLRQLLDWQQDLKDAHEFMEHLKIDLFADEVFVFTPRGDVVDLPGGSIPLDFAYKIHTDIGNRCVGARVNGRIVPLEYKLKTGDIVEIITSKQGNPSRDWLKFVKSSQAKSKIRAWFKKERREENISKGRESLEREIRRLHLEPHLLLKEQLLEEVGTKFNLLSVDDVYAAVGYGGVSSQQVITKLQDEYRKKFGEEKKQPPPVELKPWKGAAKAAKGIKVQGIDNLLIRFSKCCNPLPGDEIIGFTTRGRGISIHRVDCPNVMRVAGEKERYLQVFWEADNDLSYPVEIEVTGMDRPNFLTEVMYAVSESKVNILAVNGRMTKDKIAIIHLTFVVKDLEHLEHIMSRIKRVKDVFSVRRYAEANSVQERHSRQISRKGW